jgi:hypothetical protein
MTWYTQGRLLKVAGVEHLKGEEPLSRGHGAVERAILDDLAHNKCAIVEDLARSVAGTADPNFAISDALRSSINRALRKLARSGLIYEYDRLGPTKYWALVANKENKKRRRNKEQASEERYEEALREAERAAELRRQRTDAKESPRNAGLPAR